MVHPLVFADISGGSRLLVVNCHYALASERNEGALAFDVAADSVTFHLLEALTTAPAHELLTPEVSDTATPRTATRAEKSIRGVRRSVVD